jgi:cell division protease FtsH
LSGGPGLGKTLLAKAVAGEAGVPFFAVSASSFIELFIGTGSARVRSLFTEAKAHAPCIVFIDELDAIGRARSNGGGFGGNDEREQTINQLLTEMDGFSDNNGVVVISATNRPDILDPALVRPGRFDRLIALDPPTLKDREAILSIHTKEKPLDDTVDISQLAKKTVGLSGAELANICNEASIIGARRQADKLSMNDFLVAIDRILLGPKNTSAIISDKKKMVVAAHEAGHAVVGLKIGEYDEVTKISIVPRGKSGGVTMFEHPMEDAESGLYSRQYLENRLAVALGGRAAEEICFGEANITTGAFSDLEVVQKVARAMVVNYGFSHKLGTSSWASTTDLSPKTIARIDDEIIAITKKAYERAKNIIINNKELFNRIAKELYDKEVLEKKDINDIMKS